MYMIREPYDPTTIRWLKQYPGIDEIVKEVNLEVLGKRVPSYLAVYLMPSHRRSLLAEGAAVESADPFAKKLISDLKEADRVAEMLALNSYC